MSNVIDFRQRVFTGERNFALCQKCDCETAFVPVVGRNKDGLFITDLVCLGPHCMGEGTVISVANGVIKNV